MVTYTIWWFFVTSSNKMIIFYLGQEKAHKNMAAKQKRWGVE